MYEKGIKSYIIILIRLPSTNPQISRYFYLHSAFHLHIENESEGLIKNKSPLIVCRYRCKQFLHSGKLLPYSKNKKIRIELGKNYCKLEKYF